MIPKKTCRSDGMLHTYFQTFVLQNIPFAWVCFKQLASYKWDYLEFVLVLDMIMIPQSKVMEESAELCIYCNSDQWLLDQSQRGIVYQS